MSLRGQAGDVGPEGAGEGQGDARVAREGRGSGQGPRVTTGHPGLPSPAQVTSRHPAERRLWTAAGPADVRRVGP